MNSQYKYVNYRIYLNGYFTFFILIVLIQAFSPSSMAKPACIDLFKSSSSYKYSELKKYFHTSVKQPEAVIKKLNIPGQSLLLAGHLGDGATSQVFLVKYGGIFFALKIFDLNWETFDPRTVVIQKLLGDLNIAPKIEGTLSQAEIRKWVKQNSKALKYLRYPGRPLSSARFAILMELIDTKTLQELETSSNSNSSNTEIGLKSLADNSKLLLQQQDRNSLIDQAKRIDETLTHFNIIAMDIDATITKTGNLMLLDTGMYLYAPRLWRNHKSTLIQVFIENHTEAIPFELINP